MAHDIHSKLEKNLAGDTRERQLRDYVEITKKLIWQRQASFLAAMLLSAFYFDAAMALMCYAGLLFTEVLDLMLTRRVRAWKGNDPAAARGFMIWVMVNTALSAIMISVFVLLIAIQQAPGDHFMPLFFLFAAALFAAMNNHQIVPSLVLRLGIYGITFLTIPVMDIVREKPTIDSYLWLEFFTVIFVLYFIVDCSFMFLKLYRKGLKQLHKIKLEHDRAKRAYEIKSQFLSTMSHELRTPLTSIKFSLDLMDSGCVTKVPDDLKPILDIAVKNSRRLAELINETLDLQKIESGEMVFRFQSLDISRVVAESVDAIMAQANAEEIKVRTVFPDEDTLINGDEARIQQVLGNLLSNALKFSEAGDVITVAVERQDHRVRVSVEDTGAGIPENCESQVFGRFSQVDSSDQRKVGGTGLGMNISKRIIERHNGTIHYKSRVGEGTTFFLEFDLHVPDTEDEPGFEAYDDTAADNESARSVAVMPGE
ncbi:MAG: sensor histidine kinase [Pseudomonadota bacterium]|uniref:sensor histidine kinase n=1 Tax=Roseovarius TaxID=74030 RepID=UPI0022A68DF7|nr:HAMP domain-containing sensor histidine kinase [Roseovarius sp. EGI FJ00037]MCZ0811700.1 HAMP domain-containing sensor histidine kinase [Roseovarius sp. EGI FJ00037]